MGFFNNPLKRLPMKRLAIVFALAFTAHAQQHLPSNDDLRHLRAIGSPALSPDGKYVVVTLTDATADGGKTHLWLLSTTPGEPFRQLTFDRPDSTGERAAEFLPDNSAILFTARRDGKSGLYRLPLNGGESIPVKLERTPVLDGKPDINSEAKPLPVDVSSYTISPDGKTIAVIAQDPEPAARTKDKKDKKDVIWVEHEDLKNHLYLLDTQTWKPADVPILIRIDSTAWSPDATRLLVLTHLHPTDLGPSTAGTVLTVADLTGQMPIPNLPVTTHRAAFFHHSNTLLLAAQCRQDAPEGCSDLYTFDIATGKTANLTATTLKDSTLNAQTLLVAGDHRTAIVPFPRGFNTALPRIELANGHSTPVDFGHPVINAYKQQLQTGAAVFLANSSTAAPAVYFAASPTSPAVRLTQPTATPENWTAVASKPITWKRAGLTIEGLLYLPPQAGQTTKVPLIVNVHGGPTGQFTDSYSPLTNLLLAQGWAVLLANPRGSTGRGVAFEAANKDDMGNGDYLDIMAGVDEVLRTQPLDPARLALIGYSYGGEMAGFVAGKTTRFKAIVSGAPVIDQFSEYGTESDSFGDRWFTGMPWRNFESAWRQSPLAYAGKAKTPFLLLQGQTDTTDPEGQSREMYRALRQEGIPVQLLLFPREDHGALGGNFSGAPSTEPWHGEIARDHMLRFITDAFDGKVELTPPN